MLALCRQSLCRQFSWLLAALVRLAGPLACVAAMVPVAAAADVYFPATSAYDRHNYDPFDQAAQPATDQTQATHSSSLASQALATQQVPEAGDIQLSSDVRLLGSDPFDHSSPVALPPIAPAAYQTAAYQAAAQSIPPAPPESLPAPPDGALPRGAAVDEPGSNWTPKPLHELTTNTVLPGGVLPRDYWAERTPQHLAFFDPCGQSRGWPVNNFNWVASCLCHNPLYFEEVNLERYGYGCGCYGWCCTNAVQSLSSAAHFFGNVALLPYKMGVDCPCECDYTLGHYRPGSCPPRRWHCCTRCSALGAASAGGVAMGLIFLIP